MVLFFVYQTGLVHVRVDHVVYHVFQHFCDWLKDKVEGLRILRNTVQPLDEGGAEVDRVQIGDCSRDFVRSAGDLQDCRVHHSLLLIRTDVATSRRVDLGRSRPLN